VCLPELGITVGALKGIVRGARLMVTNDTGPRHIAAAFGVPLVSLFGPTDHRWTTIPTRPEGPEELLLADPTLPETELANDHPERCRIDRIGLEAVVRAVDLVAGGARRGAPTVNP
jgi:ADP-heptose:LPS heptosyltransferase